MAWFSFNLIICVGRGLVVEPLSFLTVRYFTIPFSTIAKSKRFEWNQAQTISMDRMHRMLMWAIVTSINSLYYLSFRCLSYVLFVVLERLNDPHAIYI